MYNVVIVTLVLQTSSPTSFIKLVRYNTVPEPRLDLFRKKNNSERVGTT